MRSYGRSGEPSWTPMPNPARFVGLVCGLLLLRRVHDGDNERRQIVWLSAGDQVAVANDLGVRVLSAGVDHVVLDREETGGLLAAETRRRAQHPGAMADGANDLVLLNHGPG